MVVVLQFTMGLMCLVNGDGGDARPCGAPKDVPPGLGKRQRSLDFLAFFVLVC